MLTQGCGDRSSVAAALNVDVKTLSQKIKLLKGICEETAELLRDKHVPISTFAVLRKIGTMRQIEAAELMVAMNTYTSTYAKSLLAATPQAQLADTSKPKTVKGLSDEQMALMEQERQISIALSRWRSNHTAPIISIWCWLRATLRNYWGTLASCGISPNTTGRYWRSFKS